MMIQRKRLLEKINHLGGTEHAEILRIIKEHGVTVTENKNGVFFNMTTLQPDTFQVVEEFVNYCYDNKIELDKYDQKLHECKYFNKNPSFVSAYGVNEPKSKRPEDQANESALQRSERMEKSHKLNDFVRKLCASTPDLGHGGSHAMSNNAATANKRGGGNFTTCKKKFMKRSAVDNDPMSMMDVLELDARHQQPSLSG